MFQNRYARAIFFLCLAGLLWLLTMLGSTATRSPEQLAEESRTLWVLVAALFLAGRMAAGLVHGWLARSVLFAAAFVAGSTLLGVFLALIPWAIGAPVSTIIAIAVALLFFPGSGSSWQPRRPGASQGQWFGDAQQSPGRDTSASEASTTGAAH